jgi:hypothetical protein
MTIIVSQPSAQLSQSQHQGRWHAAAMATLLLITPMPQGQRRPPQLGDAFYWCGPGLRLHIWSLQPRALIAIIVAIP